MFQVNRVSVLSVHFHDSQNKFLGLIQRRQNLILADRYSRCTFSAPFHFYHPERIGSQALTHSFRHIGFHVIAAFCRADILGW